MQGQLKGISFQEVLVTILSVDKPPRVLIRWQLAPTTQNLKNLGIYIDRGESPNDLKQINTTPIPANVIPEYVDQDVKLKDLEKVYYYRVRAVETLSGTPVQTFSSDPVSWEGLPDMVAMYIVEEHLFAHRYVYGVPALVFKKMKEGAHCSCFDPVLKRVTQSNHKECHGTGYIQGYYNPLEVWVDFNPDPKTVQIPEFGERQPSQTDIQFTNYPLLSNGDIFVELTSNRFWRVVNVRNTEKNRTTILQVCRMDEINRSDIEYSLTIPDEVRLRMLGDLRQREKESEF